MGMKVYRCRAVAEGISGRSKRIRSKKRMDQRAERISCSRWRYRYEHDHDDSCQPPEKWQPLKNPTMEALAKSDFFRFPARRTRKFRRYPYPSCSAVLPRRSRTRDVDVITTRGLSDAFDHATETAYKAVMKPKEGTILTVAKGMADKAVETGDRRPRTYLNFQQQSHWSTVIMY